MEDWINLYFKSSTQLDGAIKFTWLFDEWKKYFACWEHAFESFSDKLSVVDEFKCYWVGWIRKTVTSIFFKSVHLKLLWRFYVITLDANVCQISRNHLLKMEIFAHTYSTVPERFTIIHFYSFFITFSLKNILWQVFQRLTSHLLCFCKCSLYFSSLT